MPQSLTTPRLIERSRLLRQLQHALESGHVFLTAPAGYGKSVALRALAAHRPDTYLAALTPADADVTVLSARLSPRLQSQNTLLLDDIHLLAHSREATGWLQEQLARSRPCWVLAGRQLPFDGELLTLSGQATRLNGDTLAFTLDEAAMLLDRDETSVAPWHRRLQGWSLALSLLSRLPEGVDPIPATEARLFKYLAASVFDRLLPDLMRFLHVTAVPLRFHRELAVRLWDGKPEQAEELLEEVQRRNLFLQPEDEPGWFRYHDLIRTYLNDTAPFDRAPLVEESIRYLKEGGELETAIEQALDAGYQDRAASLLEEVSDTFLWDHARHLTFHRWVTALNAGTQARHPGLLRRMAQSLHYLSGRQAEAWQVLRRAQAVYQERGDAAKLRQIQQQFAWFHMADGDYRASLEILEQLLADPGCEGRERIQALHLAASAYGNLAEFGRAETALQQTIREAGDDKELIARLGEKLALHVYIPRGRFGEALAAMQAVEPHYAGKPSYRIQYLMIVADAYSGQGDWETLGKIVTELESLLAEIELPENHQKLWTAYNKAQLAIAASRTGEARQILAQAVPLAGGDPVGVLCLDRLRMWCARRAGDAAEAIHLADRALAAPAMGAPYYRALVALERDLAAGLTWDARQGERFALHPETLRLAGWRCRADLVRLRALLAVACYRSGDPRWRRHARAALFARRYFCAILTRRDPDLGAAFWAVLLSAGESVEDAHAALVEIGQIGPLLEALEREPAPARARLAAALAEIGDERAMPVLARRLGADKSVGLGSPLRIALERLESVPPPALRVQMLGDFRLTRGEAIIPQASWPRPIVFRLFCYLALHKGKTLSRERLLDDLWPHTDPEKAWNSFRTLFSGLRKVLEPCLRPKVPLRYVALNGERFVVDPFDVIRVDALAFEKILLGALAEQERLERLDAADLIAALESWAPLLPELPLEDWLLEPRQRLEDLYSEGALLAGRVMLAQGKHSQAARWAGKAIERAPWLEAAYQTLMRAHARQGERTLALQVYQQAVEGLKEELGIAPSPLTEWLAARLREGQQI